MRKSTLFTFAIIIFSLLMFVQCSENPLQIGEKTDPPQIEMARGGNGGNGGGGGGRGGGGGQGGKPGPTDNQRGDEFGDLYVVLRGIDGQPITITVDGEHGTEEKPQPIAFVWDGTLLDGEPVLPEDENYLGEGFPEEFVSYGDNWAGCYTYVEEGMIEYDMVTGDMVIYDDRAPNTVELGRKNIARSPQSVLDNGLREALKSLEGNFDLKIDYCGRLVGKVNGDPEEEDKTIDSPRENMALYQALMLNEGFGGPFMGTEVVDPGFELNTKLNRLIGNHNFGWLDIAASCFAAAADKFDNLTVDEIVYVNGFLGINDDGGEHYNHYAGYLYDRGRYGNRNIHIAYINGGSADEDLTILDAEGTYFFFTQKYNWETNLAGFRTAADDAMQVLEFIHDGDNIVDWMGFTQ